MIAGCWQLDHHHLKSQCSSSSSSFGQFSRAHSIVSFRLSGVFSECRRFGGIFLTRTSKSPSRVQTDDIRQQQLKSASVRFEGPEANEKLASSHPHQANGSASQDGGAEGDEGSERIRAPDTPSSESLREISRSRISTSLCSPYCNESHNNEGDLLHLGQDLEIRRNVVAGILKELMTGTEFKLSGTFSDLLLTRFPTFIDRIVVAASLTKKQRPSCYSSFEARVREYIQRSNVVSLIWWLKHNSLSSSQIGKLLCSTTSEHYNRSIRGIIHWLKSIHVSKQFLGYIIKKVDNILNRSTAELEEIVHFLEVHGISRKRMGFMIIRCPQILSLPFEEIKSRANFYFKLGINGNDFWSVVVGHPKSLYFFSLQLMNDKIEYLMQFGLSPEEVRRLLIRRPQLMGCCIEAQWKPLVKYLYSVGVSPNETKTLLVGEPTLFCRDLETCIAPKVCFLRDTGVSEKAIGGLLVRFPVFLTYSLHNKIQPVVVFLMIKAGVSQLNIGKVIAMAPELISCSITKLEANVEYLLSLGISLQSLGNMISDYPLLLVYNLDVLQKKCNYLMKIMVRPIQDLIEFPRYFSYSLEDRIIPRHKLLLENRLNFKLHYMLICSSDKFDRRIKAAVGKRQQFESPKNMADDFCLSI